MVVIFFFIIPSLNKGAPKEYVSAMHEIAFWSGIIVSQVVMRSNSIMMLG